jgi:uncharacterized protein (DUF1330 family)
MAAERARHVVLIGLEVTDDAGYGRYRAGMTRILETYGGSFGCVIARVLKGPSDRLNRVFTIVFPDREAKMQFFADSHYREVRAQHFDGAVASGVVLGELEEEASVVDRAEAEAERVR